MRSLVVAPGDLNEAKRLDAVLGAAHELDEGVHVALVGRRIEGYDVDRVVDTARLGDRVTLAPDVSDDDFRGWLAAADVVVDLRFPHRGEVSGSLIRAMQAGKPSIVSATGTYLDAPDDAVLRVAPGPDEPVRAGRRDPHAAGGPRPADPRWGGRAGARRRAPNVGGDREGLRGRHRGDPAARPRPRPQGHGDLGQGARRHGRRRDGSARGPRCGIRAGALHASAERHRTSEVARSCVARLERTASDLRIHPRSHDIATALSVTERTSESLSLRPVARVRELYAYREILLNLVRKELKVKYTASILGAIWSILNPIVFLAVFTFVVKVLGNSTPHYPVFLLSGLLAWNLFSVAVGNGTRSVIDNGNLVKKVAFPREILPLSVVGVALVDFVLQSAVLLALHPRDRIRLPCWRRSCCTRCRSSRSWCSRRR